MNGEYLCEVVGLVKTCWSSRWTERSYVKWLD